MRFKALLILMLIAVQSIIAGASTMDYTTPGTYLVPTNCGFEVLGSVNGWVRISLTNDGSRYADLWARYGAVYPLQLATITIFSSAQAGAAGIRVDTTPFCTCSVALDPGAAAGACYTRSANGDECEQDDSRPEIADSMAAPPGTDLMRNIGFFGSGAGDLDFLGFGQGDDGEHWNTARTLEGEWFHGGVRRCRVISTSSNSFITVIAP
jgi:hypothetical protein